MWVSLSGTLRHWWAARTGTLSALRDKLPGRKDLCLAWMLSGIQKHQEEGHEQKQEEEGGKFSGEEGEEKFQDN